MIDAVVFDLDGVLIDSEEIWNEVREAVTRERGGRWHEGAQAAMMGMSSTEWSRYMHDTLGVAEEASAINAEVLGRMLERYAGEPPFLPGALAAVRRLAAHFRLAVASSANRDLIETVLRSGGVDALFAAVVSSEEVGRGKPAPDVYLEAARRLAVPPARCAAVEDSTSGLLAADAAGMRVVAIPNRAFPPTPEALAMAEVVLDSVGALTPALIQADFRREPRA
jgi:HAD superfamily hydrolase (TIGR01509 family)